MYSRRKVVGAGVGAVLSAGALPCVCHAQPARSQPIFGCMLPASRAPAYLDKSTAPRLYITGEEPIVSRSGDKDFDYALAQTLAKISTVFNVLPGFAYYEDVESLNAYATSRVRLNNADGTVLFGQNLLRQILATKDNPDVAVAAVCAHEFAHILQFKHGLNQVVLAGQRTVKRIELQADYLAGYFAGVRKRERPSFPAAVFALTQFNLGDSNVNHESHHGTQEERGKAVSEGFAAYYSKNMTIAAVIEASTKYVMGL